MIFNERGRALFILIVLFSVSLAILFPIYQNRVLGRPDATPFLFVIKLFAWVGGCLLGYSFFRAVLRRNKTVDLTERTGRESGSGLVVNAFQGIVHQLKQKEKALTQMHEYILQSVTSGIVTFSQAGLVTTVNPAAESILDLQGETMLGADCEALFGTDSPIPHHLEEVLNQTKEAIREECHVVSKNSQKKILGVTTSGLRDPHGKIIGAVIVLTDLTEMKRLQEQVDVKKRLEMMGEISAWIAHEFRNYMGTIMGYASLLAKEFPPETTQQGMAQAISRECTTMDRLITDLLTYGKKSLITVERINLTSLIQETLKPFLSMGPKVRFVIDLASCEIDADGTLIRQALFNLIQNGIEAMGRSGVLTLRLIYKDEQSIELKISDTGKGIPKDQVNLIFLPFFTTREEGNGLGLALVHKVILSHNGMIWVASQPGEGTTFTITLPVHHV